MIEPLQVEGVPTNVRFRLSGTANALNTTWNAMSIDLIIALVIVYLVMAILFESFIYPLIIMVSVPVAAAGGVGGLAVLNLYVHQPLDMLTLLGVCDFNWHCRQQCHIAHSPIPTYYPNRRVRRWYCNHCGY